MPTAFTSWGSTPASVVAARVAFTAASHHAAGSCSAQPGRGASIAISPSGCCADATTLPPSPRPAATPSPKNFQDRGRAGASRGSYFNSGAGQGRCHAKNAKGRKGKALTVGSNHDRVSASNVDLMMLGFPVRSCSLCGPLRPLRDPPRLCVTLLRTPAQSVGYAAGMSKPRPTPLGNAPSFGFGDRLGSATPGHLAALRASGGSDSGGSGSGGDIRGIFAQQSIREMARTDRQPDEVMRRRDRRPSSRGRLPGALGCRRRPPQDP